MKLKQQGLILIGSSLLVEICFTWLLWQGLAPVQEVLRYRSAQVSIITTLQLIFNSLLRVEDDLYSTCRSHSVFPPGHTLEAQDRQLRYRTGRESEIEQVRVQDNQEIRDLLAENPKLIEAIDSQDAKRALEITQRELVELDQSSTIRPDMHLFCQSLQTRLLKVVNDLRVAVDNEQSRQSEHFQTALKALMVLRELSRETWQKATEEWDRQEQESTGDRGTNEAVIIRLISRLNTLMLAGSLIGTLTAILLTITFGLRALRRVSVLMSNMTNFSQRRRLLPVLTGNDEFAAIDRSFHEMSATLAEIQRRERAIIDNSTELLCLLDEMGTIMMLSPSCKKILGFSDIELMGKAAAVIVADVSQSTYESAFQSVKENVTDIPVEIWMKRAVGSTVCCQWSMRWNPVDKSMACVVRDISARKEAENLKREFIAMVSQDLRRPLLATKACLESLIAGQYGEVPPAGINLARQSLGSNDRLVVLVNDLLDVDRLSGESMDLNYGQASSTDLINRSLDAVKSLAAKNNVKVQGSGQNIEFECDAFRMVQVLVNLIGNAIKFSPPEESVVCCAEIQDQSVIFRVVDKGRGIPESMKDSVFERFKQVTKSDATQKGGSGLGLAICKTIIDSHHGQIGVDSREGQGSTFWFRVPIKQPGAWSK